MYQPALEPGQVKALYYLKLKLDLPTTSLVREAVDRMLAEHGGATELIPAQERKQCPD
jgi:hypothetical protein